MKENAMFLTAEEKKMLDENYLFMDGALDDLQRHDDYRALLGKLHFFVRRTFVTINKHINGGLVNLSDSEWDEVYSDCLELYRLLAAYSDVRALAIVIMGECNDVPMETKAFVDYWKAVQLGYFSESLAKIFQLFALLKEGAPARSSESIEALLRVFCFEGELEWSSVLIALCLWEFELVCPAFHNNNYTKVKRFIGVCRAIRSDILMKHAYHTS